MNEIESLICVWDGVDGFGYAGSCGYDFCFDGNDGPVENGWNYCPSCGKPIQFVMDGDEE